MIEGLKPYAEYKESGHDWIGQLPAHWSLLPNRAIFEEVKDRNHPGDEMLSVTITRGIVRQKTLLSDTSKKDSSNINKSAYKLVQPGDIAYNKMRAWQGALGASSLRGIISPAYVVMRPRVKANSWFYHHLYRTPAFAKEAGRWSYGITSDMWSLRPEHFKMIYTVLPPPDEQAAIVRFLDHANRKIDRFIRAKRKLIALLGEQKQAIIHRAVTCGLNPSAPLKPSGIPWLGDIPAHWQIVPLKGACSIQSGVTLGKSYIETRLTEFPYLRVANVQAGHLSLKKIKTLRLPVSEAKRSMLQGGDVLMTEGGDPDKLERGCVWNGEVANCLHQNHVFAVRPSRQKMRPQYLSALLESHYAKLYFLRTAKQTTNLASTNKTTIGQFRLLLPPISEQDSILSCLAFELKTVVTAIARTEREIALMREYRTRLTADIVTGKLDVREAAANLGEQDYTSLPEDTETTDAEALDDAGITDETATEEI
ncbi:MAG: restriction endonuclease subunit S [Pseudomonadota bacterium]